MIRGVLLNHFGGGGGGGEQRTRAVNSFHTKLYEYPQPISGLKAKIETRFQDLKTPFIRHQYDTSLQFRPKTMSNSEQNVKIVTQFRTKMAPKSFSLAVLPGSSVIN